MTNDSPATTSSADWRSAVIQQVEQQQAADDANALQIGKWAELGYLEHKSSGLLQQRLKQAGFEVEADIAGMPTAFVASYGQGAPVIGLLAEYDALSGFSQAARPVPTAAPGQCNGHACGHNLLGTGAILAAVAAKNWLQESGVSGTIRVFGTPAEEGGGGKVYLAREGVFDGVDAMMNWHPDSHNSSATKANLAMIAGKFRFQGRSSHAAVAPEKGRSALHAAEAMNFMANMMREHIDKESRLHYAITETNPAPNVVPDRAEMFYFVRHPDATETRNLWERIVKAAKGAALGTETTVEYELLTGHYGYLTNIRLAEITHNNLSYVGGVEYNPQELKFAQEMATGFRQPSPDLQRASQIQPLERAPTEIWAGSSDVGDVSWLVPTNWVRTATYVPGTTPHSWQAVAASNMSIGLKGMHVAAKTMALTTVELLRSPELLVDIKAEFDQRRTPDYVYEPLIGDQAPPLTLYARNPVNET